MYCTDVNKRGTDTKSKRWGACRIIILLIVISYILTVVTSCIPDPSGVLYRSVNSNCNNIQSPDFNRYFECEYEEYVFKFTIFSRHPSSILLYIDIEGINDLPISYDLRQFNIKYEGTDLPLIEVLLNQKKVELDSILKLQSDQDNQILFVVRNNISDNYLEKLILTIGKFVTADNKQIILDNITLEEFSVHRDSMWSE